MSPTHSPHSAHANRVQQILYGIVCVLLVFNTACNTPATPTLQPTPTPQPTPKPRETLPPTLVEMDPPPSSEISPSQPLTLYFNQDMERASVEGALQLNPPVAGRFDWVDDTTVRFTPDQSLPTGQDVTVSLGTGARAANGLNLRQAVDIPYHTAGGLVAVSFVPVPDAAEVDPTSAVMVAFNRPVVALGADPASLPAAFTLSPAAPGRGEWLNTSTYIFYPEPALMGGAQYTATLNQNLTTTDGLGWAPEFDPSLPWMFQTTTPQVTGFEPVSEIPLELDAPIIYTFNQPMDAASTQAAFSMAGPDGPVSGEFTWNDDHTEMTFTPAALLKRASEYDILLNESAASAGGSTLAAPYEVLMYTYGNFALLSSEPVNGGTLRMGYGSESIKLTFASPVKQQDFNSLISIQPEPSNFRVNLAWDSNLGLYVYGDFQPRTLYTLRIETGLQDKWGQTLSEPVQIAFQTSGIQPAFTFAYPIYYGGRAIFLTPDKPFMAVSAANIASANISRASISLNDFFEYYQMDGDKMRNNPPAGLTSSVYSINLPQDVSQIVNIPLNQGASLPTGLYYFNITSNPAVEQFYAGAFLGVVSHVNLMVKGASDTAVVWAVDVDTNQPIANAPVTAYSLYGTEVGSGVTDAQGLAHLTLQTDEVFRGASDQYFVMLGSGVDDPNFSLAISDWKQGLSAWDFGIRYDYYQEDPTVYLYTDRPIYRPGQTVYYRGVIRSRENGRYYPFGIDQLQLQVQGPYSADTGKSLASNPETLPVSSQFGTFSGSYVLPDDATPGTYTFNFLTEGLGYPYISFIVAEYRKPEIEMTVNFADGVEIAAGQDIQATITSKYYFGAPAANMKISWSLYSYPDYFYLPGFETGPSDTRWLLPPWAYWESGLGNYLAGGEVETAADGTYSVNIPWADIQETLAGGSPQTLTLEANLIQEGEYPVSGRSTLTVHPDAFYIGVNPEQWVGQAGKELGFSIQTVDWQKKNAGQIALHAVFNKVEWKQTTYNADSGSYDYEQIKTEVASTDLSTDGLGQARVAFTPPDAGVYEVTLTGGNALSQSMVWVTGVGYAPWPAQANNRLRLTVDADQYEPGQTAQIFIPNPFGPGAVGLVTLERGEVMRTDMIQFSEAGYTYALPLTDEDAPNIYFSVVVLGKTQDGIADFRAGYVNLQVTPSAYTLNVSLTPSPEQGEPGGTMRFDVLVTDRDGNPVQGEFSLAVVDKAIFALASPNAEPILDAFYSVQPLAISTSLSLAAYGERAVALQLGRGGGGGDGSLTPTLREKFEDTAFWSANIVTDASGRAQVEFPLPDNLTTWVATLRGLSSSTQVGEAVTEVVVSKDLLVRPVTPRFLVVGDRVQLGANVNNNTANDLTGVQVTLQANGVELEDAAAQTVDIPAHGRVNLTWWARVQDVESVELIYSAKSGDLEDVTRPVWGNLPVLHYSSSQSYGTAGMLAETGEQLEVVSLPRSFTPTGGDLTVELSPSLGAGILDGLKALEKFPYDITEPVVSRLFANTAAYNVLKKLNLARPELKTDLESAITEGVAWLQTAQNQDGSWSWLPSTTSPDMTITCYSLLALVRAQQAGFEVSEQTIDNARTFISGSVSAVSIQSGEDLLNSETFKAYVLSESGYSVDLSSLYALRDRLAPYARAMLAMAYKYQYPDNTQEYRTLLSDLEGSAVRSATGAHWESPNPNVFNFDSANFNSAVVILALAKFDPANPLLTDAVRYLVITRNAGGWWTSSYDSAWVLYALAEAMSATGDLQADYAFSASLNGDAIAAGQASSPDALTTVTSTVPLSVLYPADPNALRIQRGEGSGRLYYRAFLRLNKPVEEQAAVNKGMTVTRSYYLDGQDCVAEECQPITDISLAANQNILVRVTLTLPHDSSYLVVEDFFPAGAEVMDATLNTTQQGGKDSPVVYSWTDYFSRGYGYWFFGTPKVYDDHVRWAATSLSAGTYELTYRLTPIQAGEFRAMPTHAYEYYFPDVEGSSAGSVFTISQ